ncbi:MULTISPECIES: carbohydrate ABC transporter permease [unclassified Cellulosimicrobium]|jgi:multiple sugar transport system permease protein|uniref:carbohydrate ABC transporter permease n=1 Tax=Cellulosimicrobium TaxID=157920 RepID=UPI000A328231|nr:MULTISPECIES: sugar ABC transporter permease [unclassified Cellulosimicrobium]
MTTTLAAGRAPVVAAGPGPAARRRRARTRERATQWLFLVPAIVYVLVFFGYPIVKNLVMGSQDYTVRTFVSGEAPWVGLDNYAEVVSSGVFRTTVVNTALFTVGSLVGQFVIGLLFALFFKRRFPLGNVLRSLLLLPWLLPMIAGTAVWKWILDQDGGVLNEALRAVGVIDAPIHWLTSPDVALVAVVLVNVWVGIPFNMTLLYSGLQNIPDELYEAGALDGATGAKAFWHITWPNLRPVVSVVLVLGVIYTLKVLDIILGLTGGGPANATQTLATDSYRRSFQEFSFGTGAAVSNILIVVSLLFAVVYLRVNRRAVDE